MSQLPYDPNNYLARVYIRNDDNTKTEFVYRMLPDEKPELLSTKTSPIVKQESQELAEESHRVINNNSTMAPPPKPSASKANASKSADAEAKPAAAKSNTISDAEAIAARVKQLTVGQQAPTRLLSEEIKKTVVGKTNLPKRCGGPGVCQLMLCEHRNAPLLPRPVSASASTSDELNAKILELLLQKLKDEGYYVTRGYASCCLKRSNGKLALAMGAIKHDIDAREKAIALSGRISLAFEKSHQCVDIDNIKCPAHSTSSVSQDGLPLQRDTFLMSLVHEDNAVRDVGEKGWESELGKSLRSEPARRPVFDIYQQEAKFRAARQAFFRMTFGNNLLKFDADKVEEIMEAWDAEHTYERDPELYSSFRQQAKQNAAKRAQRKKDAEAKLDKGKGIAVEVEEAVEPEIKEDEKVEPQSADDQFAELIELLLAQHLRALDEAPYDRRPSVPEIRDERGIWDVETVDLYNTLFTLNEEITGGAISMINPNALDISLTQKRTGIEMKDCASCLITICAGSCLKAIAFFNAAEPVVQKFCRKRGDMPVTKEAVEKEFIRYSVGVCRRLQKDLKERQALRAKEIEAEMQRSKMGEKK